MKGMPNMLDAKRFIFLTDEGSTFQPGSSALEPDVENLQVVGFGEGSDANAAFEAMLFEYSYLKQTSFDKVFALRLSGSVNETNSNQFSIQSK